MLVCVHNMPAIDYLQSILWDHSTHSMLGVSACFIPSATAKQVKKKTGQQQQRLKQMIIPVQELHSRLLAGAY